MTRTNKKKWLLGGGLAALAVLFLLLAGSLSYTPLNSGEPFSLQELYEAPGAVPVGGGESWGNGLVWLLRVSAALMMALIPLYVLYAIFTRDGRKRLLNDLILIGLTFLLLEWVQRFKPAEAVTVQPQAMGDAVPAEAAGLTPTEAFNGTAPDWMLPLTVVGVAVALAGLATLGVWWWARRNRGDSARSRAAEQAELAAQRLEEGADLGDVILTCYAEMTRILVKERGLERPAAATPREFEKLLAANGLPQAPVGQLTRLFEKVRYGHRPAGEEDQRAAVSALREIAAALRPATPVEEARA